MNEIKAIETIYKGYRFRSRLEARWAVFFDTLNIKFEYEKEGFELEGERYLPDFYLPDLKTWIEIKPDENISDKELRKLVAFDKALKKEADESDRKYLYILAGSPYFDGFKHSYKVFHIFKMHNEKDFRLDDSRNFWTQCPMCLTLEFRSVDFYGSDEVGIYCNFCDLGKREINTDEVYFHKGIVITTNINFPYNSPLLMIAYQSARSKRFEFGESDSSVEKTSYNKTRAGRVKVQEALRRLFYMPTKLEQLEIDKKRFNKAQKIAVERGRTDLVEKYPIPTDSSKVIDQMFSILNELGIEIFSKEYNQYF